MLSEPNLKNLSLSDDNAPIVAQKKVDMITRSISEDSEIKVDDEETDDKDTNEDERTPSEVRADNRKRSKKSPFVDHYRLTTHDPKNPSDSVSGNIAKAERYKAASQLRDDITGGMRTAHKMPTLSEYDDFMSTFIDGKMQHQARMTDTLKSTLKSLDRNIHIDRRRTILSEDKEV
jgi:hypothetical protein